MNQQKFEQGYAAYQMGDWARAAALLAEAKGPGEVSGRIDHLLGNALMKLGRYDEAARAYGNALADTSYGMKGALGTNRGRALLAAGRYDAARDALSQAADDPTYSTPYKAYMALGSACRALGDVRGAGIAYRSAAIDESNPDPSSSLRKLGNCFMDLGRPTDAVESYRTALDFSNDMRSQSAIYCELALAYVAANRMSEAVDAFDHATADGAVLTPEAQAAYDAAKNAASARSGNRVSETDDLLAAAGYGEYTDPLDPTGETTGNLMPSPEDTGFFSISEEEIVENDRRGRRRGGVKRFFAVLLVILLILAAGGGVAYYMGFGWPTQESVVRSLFDAKASGQDISEFLSKDIDDVTKQQIDSVVVNSSGINIGGATRSMGASEVAITSALNGGGEQSYSVHLVRDGIGWKVSSIEQQFTSSDGENTTTDVAQPAPSEPAPEAAPAPEQAPPAEAAPAEAAPAEQAPAEEAPAEAPSDDATQTNGEVAI
ncbi:MAG: tetratricopeptide repeat protein [Atopobiaceae bacterium]|nr:tetratricopeptide repeat protein [Atopobiaceae bacterium]